MNLKAVSLQNPNFTKKIKEPNLHNNEQNFKVLYSEPELDKFTNDSVENSQEKVSFKEGFKLVGKGFVNKLKTMATSIICHPVKTALAVGATSLLIAGAPLIGVASATAGSILALGFAAFAVGKTAVDVVETVKDNKEGKYDEVRQDLQQIGGDGVDLALSLPFAPKAIKQVSRFAKYGRGTVGLNTELLSNLKNCRSYSDVSLEFAKADTLINYEMIGNEMGLAVKPKLVFKDMLCDPQKGIFGGAYEPTTGELQINKNILTGKGRMQAKMGGLDNTEVIIRHELEHFKQFSNIARTENIGIDGLSSALTEYYDAIKKMKMSAAELEKNGISSSMVENMTTGDKSAFNTEFYQKVVNEQGVIKSGTQQAEMSAKYAKGMLEKVNPNPETLAEFEEAVKGINTLFLTPFDKAKILKAQLKMYKSNILEKEAFGVQDKFTASVIKGRPTMANNVVMADALAEEYFSEDDFKLIDPDKSLYAKMCKK